VREREREREKIKIMLPAPQKYQTTARNDWSDRDSDHNAKITRH
jgi:hypothetical protein